MMTLAHAKRAVNDARLLNTLEVWRDAALAFEVIATGKPCRFKPAPAPVIALTKRPKAEKMPKEARHTGRVPLLHVGRCTLADGYTVRVTCGQFKGETVSDSLSRLSRFTIGCWRNEHQPIPGAIEEIEKARRGMRRIKDPVDRYPWERAVAYFEMIAKTGRRAPIAATIGLVDYTIPHPNVVDLRIVKWGAGPDVGIDLEEAAIADAAE